MAAKQLAAGIDVIVDDSLNPFAVELARQTPHPTCFVTIELPYPLSAGDVALWPPEAGVPAVLLAYQPLVLAAKVGLGGTRGNTIQWRLEEPVKRWLVTQLLQQVSTLGVDRVLARLTLHGNFIWEADDRLRRFLDGDAFADRQASTAQNVEVDLPSGDDRRGGTFEMWFWLAARAA